MGLWLSITVLARHDDYLRFKLSLAEVTSIILSPSPIIILHVAFSLEK